MKYLKYGILFLVISTARASGDDAVLKSARIDFKKTNGAYSKLTGLSVDTYYQVYNDQASQSLVEAKNGKFIKYNDNTYTLIDDIEIYSIKEQIISINKDNKQITVGDH